MESSPKVGVALSSGSAIGIAHIGVLRALIENKIPIDCIAGTSAGAVIATGFAFGVSLEKMAEKAKNFSWYSISSFPNSKLGLVSNRTLEKLIEDFVGGLDLGEAKIPLAVIATNIENGEKVVFRSGRAASAVCASACIPGFFVPVEIGGMRLVDGALVESLPLSPLSEMGADIKIGIYLGRWFSDKKVVSAFDVMSNAVDILSSHQARDHAENVDVLIEPDLRAYGPSDFQKADRLIEAGYRATILKIPEIKKVIEEKTKQRKSTRFIDRVKRWFIW